MSSSRWRLHLARLGALGVSVTLAACAPSLRGSEPREPNRALPATFGAPAAAANPSSPDTEAPRANWAELFRSAELRALIDAALRGNQELNVELQEIIIARNEVSARQGEVLPRAHAEVGAGVEKVGERTSQGVSDEAHGVPANLGNFQFGLAGSWEVDVWKRLRNAVKAADLRYLASVEARNFLITQIVAEIARSYYELVALDSQVDVLKQNIALQTDALEVVKLQKEAARATELAVKRFEAEVLKNKSRLYVLEQQRVEAENRINFLVGRFPQRVERDASELSRPVPGSLAAGLPSALLENRPDVRRAELEVAASKLDVKVAKAAFYPSLSIDAQVGYRAFNLEYRSANARQIQAVFNYERAILQAFTDVVNQLASFENLKRSYDLQAQQVEALARSTDVSVTLFQSARADYMEVLLTRRDSLDAQLELIETKKRQLQVMVTLYQALGGGWRATP
jgi:outer membrane protein TolC